MRAKLLLLFLLSGTLQVSIAQTNKSPIKVTDLLNVKSIGAIALSPDGSKYAFTVTSIEPEGDSKWDYKYATRIWLAPADGSQAPRPLTSLKENASQPAWSPDGKTLAFVRAADGNSQIFLLSMEGGEPIQLTKGKYGANGPIWSPDGKQIVFSADISLPDLLTDSVLNPKKEIPKWPFEKPGFTNNSNLNENTSKADPDGNIQEVRAYLANNEKDNKAKVIDKLRFQEESTTSSEMSFSQVFVIDAKPGSTAKNITSGFYDYNGARFIGNTGKMLLQTNLDNSEHPDRVPEGGIYMMNIDGSNLKLLLGSKGMNYGLGPVSPSGKWMVFVVDKVPSVSIGSLKIMPVDGNESSAVTIPMDRSVGNFKWSSDEKYLYFNAASNGGIVLYRYDIAAKKVEQLTDFNSGIGNYALRNNTLIYVKTEVQDPFDIYIGDAHAKNSKRVTSFNYDWVKDKNLSIPEKHTFTNEKGMTIEYWVMKPVGYTAGKKYPLLLEIHGGPAAMWGPGESSMWHEYQYFCSKGYGVVYCNPRGSGGYGVDFLRGNINDWGKGPTSDVLTALDKTVAEGWADTSKLLVTGGSYAGYLVAWIIAHDHRFKAACSQRGVYELNTFFGEGNAWILVPEYFGGYPWEAEARQNLDRESPLTYVKDITTPYIIFHGENDLRTGTVQGEMLYKSLKVMNRPVEYVRHPGATHEITRSGNNRQRIDQMLRTWEFFERWIH
ncbi:MAG: S9 family peptidase [Bacteroidetes bacterium]|nr:MAG: S9 family peptidase [Bacteroidota bacterium]